jgi:chemotaxis regulatin CheY-phosphate phosphatase CheZ
MKRLTEDMLAANETRLQAVGGLVVQTRETLKEFGADRSHMAANQAKDLAGFVGELSKSVQEIRRAAQDRLGAFDQANRQMSKDQSKHLADYVQGLARDVTSMLRRFDKERTHMSKDLSDRLDREIADIKGAVEQVLKDAADAMHEQHSGMVKARQAWQEMCAAIGQARSAGLPTPAEGGPAARTPKRAGRKGHGKKVAAQKS